MNPNAKQILTLIEQYLNEYPNHRFTQALFNLKINEFSFETDAEIEKYSLRDNTEDTDDEILKRIEEQSIPLVHIDSILILLVEENDKIGRTLFFDDATSLNDIKEYNWSQTVIISNPTAVAQINKTENSKRRALQRQNYERAREELFYQHELIRKVAETNKITDFKIKSHRDFEDVRYYLLLKTIPKNESLPPTLNNIKVGDTYHYKEGLFIGYVTVLENNSTDEEYSFKLQTELSNREPLGENGVFTIGMSRTSDLKGYGINLENTVYKFAPAWERQESFITKAKGCILFV